MSRRFFFASIVAFSLLTTITHAGVIPLVVSGRTAPNLEPTPVKCGVPFPQGAYLAGESLQLVNHRGEAEPFQTIVTATWDKAGKQGVRWLLLDFIAAPDTQYALLFGKDVKAIAPAPASIGTEADGIIRIDTGVMKAQSHANRFDLFASLAAQQGKPAIVPLMNPDDWAGPYIEHQTRGIFRADLDPDAKVTLEESGPIRATVRAEGWYTNPAGEKFCRYNVRVHFFRGQKHVKIDHTFIFTGISNDDRLTDIGVRLPLAGKRDPGKWNATIAEILDSGVISAHPVQATPKQFSMVMDSPDHRQFQYLACNQETGEVLKSGEKAAGFLHAWTDASSIAAVVRDAWQQYPFEFEFQDNVATVHLWPKHGRVWDTSWDGMWWFLTDRQKHYNLVIKPKVGEAKYDAIVAKMRKSTATCVAKTHELWLFVSPSLAWEIQPAAYHDYIHEPVIAHADLNWQCASRALDYVPHQPYDNVNFPNEEAYLTTMLDMMNHHVDVVHYYGWWDFGAYHQHMQLHPVDGDPADTGGQPIWHRAKPKSHYYWGSFPWVQYFRTGQSRWLSYAQRYTKYTGDMAFRHHDDKTLGRNKGDEYHYDNSELHWIGGWYGAPGGAEPIIPTCDRDDLLWAWWLTGDRNARDTLLAWGENIKVHGPAWIDRLVVGEPYGNWTRNIGGTFDRLMLVYMATWDEDYLKLAERLADLFRNFDYCASLTKNNKTDTPDPKLPPANTWYMNWTAQALFRYAVITGDENYKKIAVDAYRAVADMGAGHIGGKAYSLNWLYYGYALSGDPHFLDLGRRAVDGEVAQWVRKESFQAGANKFLVVTMPRMLGAFAAAPDAWKKANLPTQQHPTIELLYYHPDGTQRWPLKTQPIYMLDENDSAFSVRFIAFRGGRFTLFDPDGKAVASTEVDWMKSCTATLAAPADGKRGTYTLMCTRQNNNDEFHTNRYWDYPAQLMLLSCDLKKVVYPVESTPGAWTAFTARSWCFGIPAGVENAAIHYRPAGRESAGQRDFTIEAADGSYVQNTAEMPAHYHAPDGAPAHYNCFTFVMPSAKQDRIFRCAPGYEAGRFLKDEAYHIGRSFAIVGAPPFISAEPEAWFAPTLPARYETVP